MLSNCAHIFADLGLACLGVLALWYFCPFLTFALKGRTIENSFGHDNSQPPFLWVLAPCFNGRDCLPSFLESMRLQNYPRERYRVVVIADNCTDDSALQARELGADEVYERTNPNLRGKGYALDEYLQGRLQVEAFDLLLLFDIDAQVGPDYFSRAASHATQAPIVVQGSTESKNPDESMLARIGDLIQPVLRLHQSGRSLLGLPPILIGSHGICISRAGLARLEWQIAPKGLDGDDLEMGLRCFLKGVPIVYVPELQVLNDLPTGGNDIRYQRRRWTRSVLRLAPSYTPALVRKGLTGAWKAWDVLIGVLLLPSFSNFFLILAAVAAAFTTLFAWHVVWKPEAVAATGLLGLYVLYLVAALQYAGAKIRWKDALGILCYLAVRAIALAESFIFIRSKEWWPTAHPGKSRPLLSKPLQGGPHG